ncbi:MAG: universal stress protein [Longimicrobiales bacterium]
MPGIAYISGSDGPSGDAFRRAVALARAAGSSLTVLTPEWTARGEEGSTSASHWPRALHDSLPRETSLVIKAVEGRRPGRECGREKEERAILRSLPFSVWLLPEKEQRRGPVILAAVALRHWAPSPADSVVLRTAAALARWEGSQLHVVHAWTLVGESILASHTRGMGPARTRRLLRGARRERQLRLEELLETEGVVSEAAVTLAKGDPHKVIRDVVRETRADVLVGGYEGRSGLWRILGGNLLEKFLGTEGLAVFAVRAGAPPFPEEASPLWKSA